MPHGRILPVPIRGRNRDSPTPAVARNRNRESVRLLTLLVAASTAPIFSSSVNTSRANSVVTVTGLCLRRSMRDGGLAGHSRRLQVLAEPVHGLLPALSRRTGRVRLDRDDLAHDERRSAVLLGERHRRTDLVAVMDRAREDDALGRDNLAVYTLEWVVRTIGPAHHEA